jgi:hypothetical protein
VINNSNDPVAMFPTMDAVQEFKVQTADYSAEYGGHADANLQLQLRSGANAFHGELFEFLRNNLFDRTELLFAISPSQTHAAAEPVRWHRRRSVIRNKTFFMASYEGTRERRQTAANTSVLTPAQRAGIFSGTIIDPLAGTPFPNNTIPQSRLNPVSVAIINQYMPLPNMGGAINLLGGQITQDQYMTRFDHKDQVFGHYIYHGGNYPSLDITGNFTLASYYRNQSVAFQYIHTFNTATLNEFRFGYQRGTLNQLSPRGQTGFTAEKDPGIIGMRVGEPSSPNAATH